MITYIQSNAVSTALGLPFCDLSDQQLNQMVKIQRGSKRSKTLGWKKGRPNPGKALWSTGSIFITNGLINKIISKDAPIPEGFRKGRNYTFIPKQELCSCLNCHRQVYTNVLRRKYHSSGQCAIRPPVE